MGDVEGGNVPRYFMDVKGSMICNTFKRGAKLIKKGLFWICNRGLDALFFMILGMCTLLLC
jgi:hypothetical protein